MIQEGALQGERIIEVALPLPVQTPFSYRVPPGLPSPLRGARVLVPFGARRTLGVVTGAGAPVPGLALKDVLDVVDETPILSPTLLDLAAWVADHYLAPPGECYRLLLPPSGLASSRAVARLVEGRGAPSDPIVEALRAGPLRVSTLARRLGKDPTSRLARLRREGIVQVDQDLKSTGFRNVQVVVLSERAIDPRGRGQAEVLERLRRAGGRRRLADLVRDRPSLRRSVAGLVEAGGVRIEEEADLRAPNVLPGGSLGPIDPTREQSRAIEALSTATEERRFGAFLLHGVTGSGKTEVYFRAAARALDAGRTALVLVPEIALTPFLVRAAVGRFGRSVSVLHSELSAGERHDQWWQIRQGDSRVVVGARSAVFAPLQDLGLLVVDEEHEGAYKQDESPRYHARDVAVMRAKLEGAAVVLGSATPSVESAANVRAGKYTLLELPTRIGRRGLPRMEVVDRRGVLRSGGDPILTPPLREALAERLSRKEQSLLLLNRRGYATGLLCRECGLPASCPNCSVSLTLHRGGQRALCHYCGHEAPAAERCGSCRGEYLRLTGYGTEKVVEAVQEALPGARVQRLDRDLAQRRGAVAGVLAAFESGETDILVGTQMIAKGHDFPRVTLVGVIDADVGLGIPDFRAAERTFQLLTQVAGRAGRADLPGEVVLQTHLPEHYALQFALAQDFAGFLEREMEFRRTMAYPPSAALLNLVLRSKDRGEAARTADSLAERLRDRAPGRYRVLGPALAPLARLREEHRYQILLKGQRAAMRQAVQAALLERFGPSRWPGVVVDVDPMSVM